MQILPSAARVSTTEVRDLQTTGNGAVFYLRVFTASGTGGLRFRIMWEDIGGNFHQANLDPPAVTAIGTYIYIIYPSTLSGVGTVGLETKQITVLPITNPFGIQVVHLDGSSYTYGVDVSFVQ